MAARCPSKTWRHGLRLHWLAVDWTQWRRWHSCTSLRTACTDPCAPKLLHLQREVWPRAGCRDGRRAWSWILRRWPLELSSPACSTFWQGDTVLASLPRHRRRSLAIVALALTCRTRLHRTARQHVPWSASSQWSISIETLRLSRDGLHWSAWRIQPGTPISNWSRSTASACQAVTPPRVSSFKPSPTTRNAFPKFGRVLWRPRSDCRRIIRPDCERIH